MKAELPQDTHTETKSLLDKCKRSPTIDFTGQFKEDTEGDEGKREESDGDIPVGP